MTDDPSHGAGPDGPPEEIDIEAAGVSFVLRVFPDPSGLRGQVFRGEEKIAGVQIYHSDDRAALVREAMRNRAVLRAAVPAEVSD